MKLKNFAPLATRLILSGCVAGVTVDLAAAMVVTTDELTVKGTGAMINAATPDGDDKKKKDKKKQEETQQPETQQTPPPPYAPVQTAPVHARYITIGADGSVVEERDAPQPGDQRFTDIGKAA